jgi:hypothetical protein
MEKFDCDCGPEYHVKVSDNVFTEAKKCINCNMFFCKDNFNPPYQKFTKCPNCNDYLIEVADCEHHELGFHKFIDASDEKCEQSIHCATYCQGCKRFICDNIILTTDLGIMQCPYKDCERNMENGYGGCEGSLCSHATICLQCHDVFCKWKNTSNYCSISCEYP